MTEPSRVLLVLDRADRAGTERHVEILARGLQDRDWDISVAVSSEGPLLSSLREKRIPVHIIPRRWRTDPWYVVALARLATRNKAQIMHAHSGRLAVLAGRLAGVPVLIETRHGLGAVGEPPRATALLREARTSMLAHRTVTVCLTDRRRLIAAGLPSDRVICIPNGIPPAAPGDGAMPVIRGMPTPGRVRLGYLGRLSIEKNPLFLADLVGVLDTRAPGEWELCIAGEGPLRSSLERRLAAHARRGSVVWLGRTEGPVPVLSRIDMLLLPSEREGQPFAALEAMQTGVVVVARDIPSLEELLGGTDPAGLLLPADPARWADEILRLKRSPDCMIRLSEEARARVASRHSVDRMIDAIESLYRESFATRSTDC